MDETTYELVRYYQDLDVENEVIETGLSLEDAQEYCSRESTQGDGWFVGFDYA